MHISRQTYYKWQKEYGRDLIQSFEGHRYPDTREQKEWAAEREKVQAEIVRKGTTDIVRIINTLNQIDKDEKIRRKLIQRMVNNYGITEKDACFIIGFDYEQYGYKPRYIIENEESVKGYVNLILRSYFVYSRKSGMDLLNKINPTWSKKYLQILYKQYLSGELTPYIYKSKKKAQPKRKLNTANWLVTINEIREFSKFQSRGKIFITNISDYKSARRIAFRIDDSKERYFDLVLNLDELIEENEKPKKIIIHKRYVSKGFLQWAIQKKVKLQILSNKDAEHDEVVRKVNDDICKSILVGNDIFNLKRFEYAAECWKEENDILHYP